MTENKNNTVKKTAVEKKENVAAKREAYHSFLSPLFNFFDDLLNLAAHDRSPFPADIRPQGICPADGFYTP